MTTIYFGTSNPYIDGQLQWGATSNGPTANSSSVLIAIYLKRNNYGYVSYGTLNTQVVCDGMQQNENGLYVTITENDWTLVYAKTFTVSHNSDGSKTCGVSINSDSDFNFSFSEYFEFALPKIPRYTSITRWNVTAVTSSSITFAWSTADTISNIMCYMDGVVKYSLPYSYVSSGSFTIGGLSENTSYSNIKIVVTRQDSGLNTTSGIISARTSYAAPTASLSFVSATINSLSLKWSSNYGCDYIWVYNSGAIIYSSAVPSPSSGSITLTPGNWSSISPGASYSLTIKVRRSVSQALATSAAVTARTLALPAITSSTPVSFNIGSPLTVHLSNYGNNDCTLLLQVFNNTWQTAGSYTVSKGTASKVITPNASSLYAQCPNSNTLPVRISCSATCNNRQEHSNTYNLTASVTNSNPTFSGFTFETNTGTNINSIIGGTTNMLTKVGSLKLLFAASCAAGVNSASISKMEIKVLLNKIPVTNETISYSKSAFSHILATRFSAPGTYTLQLNVLDSRGNRSAVVEKTFIVYRYKEPALDIKISRQNEFEEKTYLSLTGEISKISILNIQKNTISSLKYRYAESGKEWSAYTELTGYSSTSGSDDTLVATIKKTTNENFFLKMNIEKSYNFEFVLADKISGNVVYKVFLPQGKPAFAVFENGYSVVDKVPDFSSSAKLQVGSDIMVRDESGDVMVLKEIKELKKISTSLTTHSSLLKSMYLLMHPVGHILMTTSSTNPGTLWGGTWVAWGSGRVPVGINTGNANFNTIERTGGVEAQNLSHSHTVNNHSHGMSHSHTVNSHSHTTPNHQHLQTVGADDGTVYQMGGGGEYGSAVINTWRSSHSPNSWWESGLARLHYTSSTNGGNTGVSAPGTNAGTRTSTDGSSPGTTAALSSASTLQPYITCYMWKRTA